LRYWLKRSSLLPPHIHFSSRTLAHCRVTVTCPCFFFPPPAFPLRFLSFKKHELQLARLTDPKGYYFLSRGVSPPPSFGLYGSPHGDFIVMPFMLLFFNFFFES